MDEYDGILLIDQEFAPVLTQEDAENLKPLLRETIQNYIEHRDAIPVEEWLPQELQRGLPDRSPTEIAQFSEEILTTLRTNEEYVADLGEATKQGRSKESWFAQKAKVATSHMSTQASCQYLQELDAAVANANTALTRTILTQSGAVSQNPCLDGFIAEQYHAQTFNLNAEATGSPFRAKVLEPTGSGYAKNSVDIVIVDGGGKVVSRYQSKYCKDAEATMKAFDHGDYRGQQKLVPEDQLAEISQSRKATDVIKAPDGTVSTPLAKGDAKQLQAEAQSGRWNDLNWNEYQLKDLAIGVGKQAGQAALMGAAVGVGFNVAQKLWNGETVDGAEVVEAAVTTGTDFGVKAAVAGALKIGVERGVVKCIPKGTPAGTLANIAFVAIENAKVIGKVVKGDYTLREGLDKMAQTTVGTVAGIAAGAKGTAIGATIGMAFGPVGAAVGGFIGGSIGYMAGSKLGETIVKGAQKIRDKVVEKVKSFGRSIADFGRRVASHIPILNLFA